MKNRGLLLVICLFCIFDWNDAQKFAGLYRWWLDRSQNLLTAVKEFEQRDYAVDGAAEFREKINEVSLLPLDIERTQKSIESLEAGKGIPLKQAFDALRRFTTSR